ncbi:Rpn family recombination-promoting nuclease/putative transposase [Arsenophonus endosymbiont of Aleurodicus floccissimus]|uniref:Rpn family recombination-promoting nuclease/putative transposase n=1 Tax=Arsenophonus endosymbiont of Aleurodicus floccissimus TaxID=2152761 RepID=UPI001EDF3570|nr:Rpn family recombination-promoting nuclease/putative transposase [Arsenophonus endosymbiont of Aleurodicus floccissimus]
MLEKYAGKLARTVLRGRRPRNGLLLPDHGTTSPYPYTTQWFDCFADPELAESVYRQAFPLVDITTIPDEKILTHRRVALLQLVQKHIRTRDMLELAVELANLIEKWQYSKEQCKSLLYYIAKAGNTIDGEGFIRTLAEKAPTYREGFYDDCRAIRG